MKLKPNQRFCEHNGTLYRLTVRPSDRYMASVFIERYRPHKMIKWVWADTREFWVDDFPSIEEGAKTQFYNFCCIKDQQDSLKKKWSDFENKY